MLYKILSCKFVTFYFTFTTMKIALFFGSFNPIHVGHLIIANMVVQHANVQRVWFVVSPHNPLKDKKNLLDEYNRLHLVNLAIESNSKFKASNVEFKLPQPSYTIDTLCYLSEQFPQHEFSLIMGADNLNTIHKWKNYKQILSNYSIIVYKRDAQTIDLSAFEAYNTIQVLDLPLLNISSTQIRNLIKEKKSVAYLLTEPVLAEVEKYNYYK